MLPVYGNVAAFVPALAWNTAVFVAVCVDDPGVPAGGSLAPPPGGTLTVVTEATVVDVVVVVGFGFGAGVLATQSPMPDRVAMTLPFSVMNVENRESSGSSSRMGPARLAGLVTHPRGVTEFQTE